MKRCTVCLVLLLALACRKETSAPAPAPQTTGAATTTTAGPSQDLATAKVDTILPVAPVPVSRCEATNETFTMHLNEAPEKLHVSVRIHQGDEEIAFVRQPAAGLNVATLKLPKLEPGKYRLEGLWGGNRACEAEIEIE